MSVVVYLVSSSAPSFLVPLACALFNHPQCHGGYPHGAGPHQVKDASHTGRHGGVLQVLPHGLDAAVAPGRVRDGVLPPYEGAVSQLRPQRDALFGEDGRGHQGALREAGDAGEKENGGLG